MPKRLYLLRHGQTDNNILNIIAGKSPDTPLNDTGLKQAALTAKALSQMIIHHIYMSPALRARQTAQKIVEKHIPFALIEVLENFEEINFGVLEGLTFKKSKELYKDLLETYRDYPSQCAFPEGESVNEAFERISRGISKILKERQDDESVLIISHGGTMALIFLYLFNLDMDRMFHGIRHNNCGLSIIDLENLDKWYVPQHKPRIICMNDISHLKEKHY